MQEREIERKGEGEKERKRKNGIDTGREKKRGKERKIILGTNINKRIYPTRRANLAKHSFIKHRLNKLCIKKPQKFQIAIKICFPNKRNDNFSFYF